MKHISLLFLSFFIISCSSSSSTNETDTNITSAITGVWLNTDQSTLCETSFTFTSGLTFDLTSLDNIMAGTYTVDDTILSSDKLELLLNVSTDNALSNCDGDAFSQAGETLELYINFTGSSALNIYDLFSDSDPLIILNN